MLADGEVLTHAALARRVADRARTWGPARRLVLVEGANDLDSLVAYLAALQHGHVALVVPDGRDAQRDAIVAAYDPDIVCTAGARDDVRRRGERPRPPPRPGAAAQHLGHTGSPKLVRLSRDNVASNAAAIADYLALTPADRAITTLPLHYCYGLSVLHSHLVAGASVVLTGLSVVDECFWDLFTRSGATSSPACRTPSTCWPPAASRPATSRRLRQVTQAGGRLDPDAVRRWSRFGREPRLGPRRDVRRDRGDRADGVPPAATWPRTTPPRSASPFPAAGCASTRLRTTGPESASSSTPVPT